MAHHDHGYKLLFSHPRIVRDLLTGFVKEAWVAQLDFSTLEKVSGSYITDELRDREDDIIWRVRWGNGWLYVYLLLEFQSSVDRFMAVRIMTYLGLLYQDLIRQKTLTAAALFRLEHHRDEQDMLAVLATLVDWLKSSEQTGLRRAFTVWIRRVMLPYRAPGIELPEFNDLQDLHEVHHMLAERVRKWPDRWIAEAIGLPLAEIRQLRRDDQG